MLIKPNEQIMRDYEENSTENDLYRKFNVVFSEILHSDDNSYNVNHYIKTKNGIEETIINKMKNNADAIIPILGYVGMGKTFLMHYCIQKGFNYKGSLKNRSFILHDMEGDSLCIYASYDACADNGQDVGRLASKLATASEVVIEKMGILDNTREEKERISKEVAEFIKSNKPELLQLYAESPDDSIVENAKSLYKNKKSAYEAEKLKWILTSRDTNIKSIILILDDIEGLRSQTEYEVIDAYLTMYDCLRNVDKKNTELPYKVKLFICMRERTYNEIRKVPTFNTHRLDNPLYISSGIQLHEIFIRRFNDIVNERKILDDIEKKDTWKDAKEILEELSQKLNWLLSDVVLQLCNFNICDAIQLFVSILSNRQWTQKNERVQECFKIEKYQFFLSIASCFKVMAMRNSTIYYNKYEVSNLFYDNDNVGYCLPIYILLMLRDTDGNKELTLEEIQENFANVLNLSGDVESKKIKHIQKVIKYFVEEEILFEKVVKRSETKIKYYIAPKGRVLLQYFFENTILLEIFRDDLYLDDTNHDVKCSNDINRDDLFKDTIQLIEDISEEEVKYWNSSKANDTLDIYYKLWRNERISLKLISAMKKSLFNYYRGEIPQQLNEIVKIMEKKFGAIFPNN